MEDYDQESPDAFRKRMAAFWADYPRRQRAEKQREHVVLIVASLFLALGLGSTGLVLEHQFEYKLSTIESFLIVMTLIIPTYLIADRIVPKAK